MSDGGRQHTLADSTHAMHANAGRRAADDVWSVQIGTQRIADCLQTFAPGQEVLRQFGNGNQCSQRRRWLRQLPRQVVQVEVVYSSFLVKSSQCSRFNSSRGTG